MVPTQERILEHRAYVNACLSDDVAGHIPAPFDEWNAVMDRIPHQSPKEVK